MKPTNILEDYLQDDIFISADRYETQNDVIREMMNEIFAEKKAIIKVLEKDEEFAEYEVISSHINY